MATKTLLTQADHPPKPSNILFWRSPRLACERLDCKTVGFFLKISKEIGKAWPKSLTVSPQSRSVFSASFQTFCLTARAYLNTQKYGLFCSLANASLLASLHASTRKVTFRLERSVAAYCIFIGKRQSLLHPNTAQQFFPHQLHSFSRKT